LYSAIGVYATPDKEVDSGQWIVDSKNEEKLPTNHYPLTTKNHDSAYWLRGEWFDLSDELIEDFINVAYGIDNQQEMKQLEES